MGTREDAVVVRIAFTVLLARLGWLDLQEFFRFAASRFRFSSGSLAKLLSS